MSVTVRVGMILRERAVMGAAVSFMCRFPFQTGLVHTAPAWALLQAGGAGRPIMGPGVSLVQQEGGDTTLPFPNSLWQQDPGTGEVCNLRPGGRGRHNSADGQHPLMAWPHLLPPPYDSPPAAWGTQERQKQPGLLLPEVTKLLAIG